MNEGRVLDGGVQSSRFAEVGNALAAYDRTLDLVHSGGAKTSPEP
jgi:hypothetical protein